MNPSIALKPAVLVCALLAGVAAANAQKSLQAGSSAPAAPVPSPYVPPDRGETSAAVRTYAGTRGGQTGADNPWTGPLFSGLSPRAYGHTTEASPVLYWFSFGSIAKPVEVSLVNPRATSRNEIEPALRVQIDPPITPGLHAVDLAAHGVSLEAGTMYLWQVAMIEDPGSRSQDIVSLNGIVRRAEQQRQEHDSVASDSPLERATQLAANGVWYDAVDQLIDLVMRGHQGAAEAQALLAAMLAAEENAISPDRLAAR